MTAPLKFLGHYFLLLLPPLCVLSATLFGMLAEKTMIPGARAAAVGASCAFVVLIPLTP